MNRKNDELGWLVRAQTCVKNETRYNARIDERDAPGRLVHNGFDVSITEHVLLIANHPLQHLLSGRCIGKWNVQPLDQSPSRCLINLMRSVCGSNNDELFCLCGPFRNARDMSMFIHAEHGWADMDVLHALLFQYTVLFYQHAFAMYIMTRINTQHTAQHVPWTSRPRPAAQEIPF